MQKRAKQIALCFPDLSGGGAQIANGLAHRGHSVNLIVSTSGFQQIQQLHSGNIFCDYIQI
jgi:hypothetical protein